MSRHSILCLWFSGYIVDTFLWQLSTFTLHFSQYLLYIVSLIPHIFGIVITLYGCYLGQNNPYTNKIAHRTSRSVFKVKLDFLKLTSILKIEKV